MFKVKSAYIVRWTCDARTVLNFDFYINLVEGAQLAKLASIFKRF